MNRIPLSMPFLGKEEEAAVVKIINNKWLSHGDMNESFEYEWSKFLGATHSLSVANCTAALHMACLAAGFQEGDEVIVPALSFVATSNSVLYTKAKVVFSDITSTCNLNICYKDIRRKITANTKGIIIMHYAGYSCDMNEIMKIAKEYNLVLIEDCAHCTGSSYNGQILGTFGHLSCFSFFANKNITTGEGGMVVTSDSLLAQKLRLLRSHGMTSMTLDRDRGHASDYDVVHLGFNYRMDNIRASIGLEQLKKIHTISQNRRDLVSLYINNLINIKDIVIPFKEEGERKMNFCPHLFVIILNDSKIRDDFRNHLQINGIQTSVHYRAIKNLSLYASYEYSLPNTEFVTNRLVSLPLYPDLTEESVNYICDKIKLFFKK